MSGKRGRMDPLTFPDIVDNPPLEETDVAGALLRGSPPRCTRAGTDACIPRTALIFSVESVRRRPPSSLPILRSILRPFGTGVGSLRRLSGRVSLLDQRIRPHPLPCGLSVHLRAG